MPTLYREKRGFTLIELLVVLAVIAVLTALLFPVFARVRENGRKSVCLSNMKQLGSAFALYVTDYDGHYPDFFGYSTPQGIPATWDVLIAPYTKASTLFECSSDSDSRRFHLPGTASPSIVLMAMPTIWQKPDGVTPRTKSKSQSRPSLFCWQRRMPP